MTIVAHPYLTAMRDPNIAAADYQNASWKAWWVIHAALDAEPPPVEVPDWAEIWAAIAGGRPWPTVRPREPWLIGSRRGAKTREYSRRGAWACATFDPKQLTRGERGIFAFVAPDRAQSSIAFDFAAAFVEQSPMLSAMIASRTRTELRFTNQVTMKVMTASFRTQRGVTLIGAHNDETAYFFDSESSANPFGEILTAQRPAMATVATAQLSAATTPRARVGETWKVFERYFGQNDPRTLVLRADWQTLNPTLDATLVQAALEEDESVARAEYYATWRSDIEGYVSREQYEAVRVVGRTMLPPVQGFSYKAHVDAAGGAGADSMTAAIAHIDPEGRAVLDLVLERRPPFSPPEVAAEFSAVLKQYGVVAAQADRYAGDWVVSAFARHGIAIRPCAKNRNEIYSEFLPLMTAGRCELLDSKRLAGQLLGLERRHGRLRDVIDHPVGQHDDVVLVAAGALMQVAGRRYATGVTYLEAAAVPSRPPPSPWLTPLPRVDLTKPWRYGGTTPCPLPDHMRRTKG